MILHERGETRVVRTSVDDDGLGLGTCRKTWKQPRQRRRIVQDGDDD
jgi:hypothetical protein